MPDEIDLASDRAELAREAALTQRRPAGPAPTGRCHYCDEMVRDERRWCDAECRDQWDKENRK